MAGSPAHVRLNSLRARLLDPEPQPVPQEFLEDLKVRALMDWHDRGQPDGEIDLGQVPELTKEQLAEMRKARIRVSHRR